MTDKIQFERIWFARRLPKLNIHVSIANRISFISFSDLKMVFYAINFNTFVLKLHKQFIFCSILTAAALFYGTPILFYGTSYVWQSLILDMKNALFLVPFASSKPRNCFCCVWHSWLAVQQIASHWDELISTGESSLSWNISSL